MKLRGKKILAVWMVLLVFSLTACGKQKDNESDQSLRDMKVADKIKTFTLNGCPLSVPCKVKDLPEGMSLGYGYSSMGDGEVLCELRFEGKLLGMVLLPEANIGTDSFVDMSTGYEEEMISYFSNNAVVDFEIASITPDCTLDEVVELWGEPNKSSDSRLSYFDIDEKTGKEVATISLYRYKDDDKITQISISSSVY